MDAGPAGAVEAQGSVSHITQFDLGVLIITRFDIGVLVITLFDFELFQMEL